MLAAFDKAERETDDTHHEAPLTFVVIGGGATGRRIRGRHRRAGALHAARRFPQTSPRPEEARVVLIEAGQPGA